MNKMTWNKISMLAAAVLLFACNNGPKEVPADADGAGGDAGTGVFGDGQAAGPGATPAIDPAAGADMHTVVALEALPTTKYVYVRVKEGEKEYWVASTKQEISVGRTYFYRGGLLKQDFHSNEYGRTFSELYLISQLVPADHGATSGDAASAPSITATPEDPPASQKAKAERVTIPQLFTDRVKYKGRMVEVHGTCSKVNLNIMGRNWVHLKHDSKDMRELVVNTDLPIAEGQDVTVVGLVVLDKDLGAGYKYDVLLENAKVVR